MAEQHQSTVATANPDTSVDPTLRTSEYTSPQQRKAEKRAKREAKKQAKWEEKQKGKSEQQRTNEAIKNAALYEAKHYQEQRVAKVAQENKLKGLAFGAITNITESFGGEKLRAKRLAKAMREAMKQRGGSVAQGVFTSEFVQAAAKVAIRKEGREARKAKIQEATIDVKKISEAQARIRVLAEGSNGTIDRTTQQFGQKPIERLCQELIAPILQGQTLTEEQQREAVERVKKEFEGNPVLEGLTVDDLMAFTIIGQEMAKKGVIGDNPKKQDAAFDALIYRGKDEYRLAQLAQVSRLDILTKSPYVKGILLTMLGVSMATNLPAALAIGAAFTLVTSIHKLNVDRAMRNIESQRGQANIRSKKDISAEKGFWNKAMALYGNATNVDWEQHEYGSLDYATALIARVGVGAAFSTAFFGLGRFLHDPGGTIQAVAETPGNLVKGAENVLQEIAHHIPGQEPSNPDPIFVGSVIQGKLGGQDAVVPNVDADIAKLNTDLSAHADAQTIASDVAHLKADTQAEGLYNGAVKTDLDTLQHDIGTSGGYGNEPLHLQYDVDKTLALQELTKNSQQFTDVQNNLHDLQDKINQDLTSSGNQTEIDNHFQAVHDSIMKLPDVSEADKTQMLNDLNYIHDHYTDSAGYQSYVDDITKLLAKHEIHAPSQADQDLVNAGEFGLRAINDQQGTGNPLSTVPDALGAFGNLKDYIGNGGIQEAWNQIVNHNSSPETLPFTIGAGPHATDVVIPGFGGPVPVHLPDGWHVQGGQYIFDQQGREVGYFNVENNQISFQATGYDGITAGDHIVGNISGNTIVPTGEGTGAATGAAAAAETAHTAATTSGEGTQQSVDSLFGTHNPNVVEGHTNAGDMNGYEHYGLPNGMSEHAGDVNDKILGTWQGAHTAYTSNGQSIDFYGTYPGSQMFIQVNGHYYLFDAQTMHLGNNNPVILNPLDAVNGNPPPVHLTQDSFLQLVGYGNSRNIEAGSIVNSTYLQWAALHHVTGTAEASDRLEQATNPAWLAQHPGFEELLIKNLSASPNHLSTSDIHPLAVPYGEALHDGPNHITILAQDQFVAHNLKPSEVTISHDLGEEAEHFTDGAARFDYVTDNPPFGLPGEWPATDAIANFIQTIQDNQGLSAAALLVGLLGTNALGYAAGRGAQNAWVNGRPLGVVGRTLVPAATTGGAVLVSTSPWAYAMGGPGFVAGIVHGILRNRRRATPDTHDTDHPDDQPPPPDDGSGSRTSLRDRVGNALGNLRPGGGGGSLSPDAPPAAVGAVLAENGRGQRNRRQQAFNALVAKHHDDGADVTQEQFNTFADNIGSVNKRGTPDVVAQDLIHKLPNGSKRLDLANPINAEFAAGALLGKDATPAELAQQKKAIQRAQIIKNAQAAQGLESSTNDQTKLRTAVQEAKDKMTQEVDGVPNGQQLTPGQVKEQIQALQEAHLSGGNVHKAVQDVYATADTTPETRAVAHALTLPDTTPPHEKVKTALDYVLYEPQSQNGQLPPAIDVAKGAHAIRQHVPGITDEHVAQALQEKYGSDPEFLDEVHTHLRAIDIPTVPAQIKEGLNTIYHNFADALQDYNDPAKRTDPQVQQRLQEAFKAAYPGLLQFLLAAQRVPAFHDDIEAFFALQGQLENIVKQRKPDLKNKDSELQQQKTVLLQRKGQIDNMPETNQQEKAAKEAAESDWESKVDAFNTQGKQFGDALNAEVLNTPITDASFPSELRDNFGKVLTHVTRLANGGGVPPKQSNTPDTGGGTGGQGGDSTDGSNGGSSGGGSVDTNRGPSVDTNTNINDPASPEAVAQRARERDETMEKFIAEYDAFQQLQPSDPKYREMYDKLMREVIKPARRDSIPDGVNDNLNLDRAAFLSVIPLGADAEDKKILADLDTAQNEPNLDIQERQRREDAYQEKRVDIYLNKILAIPPDQRPPEIQQAEQVILGAIGQGVERYKTNPDTIIKNATPEQKRELIQAADRLLAAYQRFDQAKGKSPEEIDKAFKDLNTEIAKEGQVKGFFDPGVTNAAGGLADAMEQKFMPDDKRQQLGDIRAQLATEGLTPEKIKELRDQETAILDPEWQRLKSISALELREKYPDVSDAYAEVFEAARQRAQQVKDLVGNVAVPDSRPATPPIEPTGLSPMDAVKPENIRPEYERLKAEIVREHKRSHPDTTPELLERVADELLTNAALREKLKNSATQGEAQQEIARKIKAEPNFADIDPFAIESLAVTLIAGLQPGAERHEATKQIYGFLSDRDLLYHAEARRAQAEKEANRPPEQEAIDTVRETLNRRINRDFPGQNKVEVPLYGGADESDPSKAEELTLLLRSGGPIEGVNLDEARIHVRTSQNSMLIMPMAQGGTEGMRLGGDIVVQDGKLVGIPRTDVNSDKVPADWIVKATAVLDQRLQKTIPTGWKFEGYNLEKGTLKVKLSKITPDKDNSSSPESGKRNEALAAKLIPTAAERVKVLQAEQISTDKIDVVGAVIQGKREHRNVLDEIDGITPGQDRLYISPNGTMAVLDGMGGYEAGNYTGGEAAQIAKDLLASIFDTHQFFSTEQEARDALKSWAVQAKKALMLQVAKFSDSAAREKAQKVGFTGVIVVPYGDQGKAVVLRIGDPEILKYNAATKRLEFVGQPQSALANSLGGNEHALTSSDLTAIYQMKNNITDDQEQKYKLSNSPAVSGRKNVVTNSINGKFDEKGQALPVELHYYTVELHEGDGLFLGSDGATEFTPLSKIDQALASLENGQDPAQALGQVLQEAIVHGGDDSGSAIIMSMKKVPLPPPSRPVSRTQTPPGGTAVGIAQQQATRGFMPVPGETDPDEDGRIVNRPVTDETEQTPVPQTLATEDDEDKKVQQSSSSGGQRTSGAGRAVDSSRASRTQAVPAIVSRSVSA